MKDSIAKHFGGNEVIFCHEKPELKWEEAIEMCPQLSKGWFELSKLNSNVRLEFIRDYWINSLPYLPHVYAFLDRFFSQVKEVGIVSAKGHVYMTYAKETAFFIGGPPLVDAEIDNFKGNFNFPFPVDYLQFFRVHNGFSKGGDTGIFPLKDLFDEAKKVQSRKLTLMCGSEMVDPQELFPFYRSFGLDKYQCFYKGWYVDGEVGNVLCALSEGTISDFRMRNKGEETLAFSTFLDWLIFYLEDVS
jgi:hypothetical protein